MAEKSVHVRDELEHTTSDTKQLSKMIFINAE